MRLLQFKSLQKIALKYTICVEIFLENNPDVSFNGRFEISAIGKKKGTCPKLDRPVALGQFVKEQWPFAQ